jgi:hypothetical protein
MIFRTFVIAATVGAAGLVIAVCASIPDPKMIVKEFESSLVVRTGAAEPGKISVGDRDERGIKLRAELDRTFERLWRAGLSRETDVTASMLPYIFPGMTFEEAERVLKAAGFEVRPHPGIREEQDRNRPTDWYAVHAAISDFSPIRIFGRVTVYVSLYPASPGDYSRVENIKAFLLADQL